MISLRTVVVLVAGCVILLPLKAETSEERVKRLEDSVLAPCCYREPVSRHQSEIAINMRLEITKWVSAGKTDEQILHEYVNRYGSKVMVDPRTRPAAWIWWVPWLTLAAGAILILLLLKRWRSAPPNSIPPSDVQAAGLPDVEDEWAP